MVRIIIAGSRSFNDYKLLENKVTDLIYLVGINHPNQNLISLNKEFEGNCFKINPESIEIISGMANGADNLGILFAKKYGLPLRLFPAKWDDLSVENCSIKTNQFGKKYNSLAGYNRNIEMADYAISDNSFAILVLFWDGKSRGSHHMKRVAEERGINVYNIKF